MSIQIFSLLDQQKEIKLTLTYRILRSNLFSMLQEKVMAEGKHKTNKK